MKKVFLSMPMHGKTDEEIKKVREEYTEQARAIFGSESVMIINNLDHDIKDVVTPQRKHYLAESIRQMVRADCVIFCPGWEDAAGCKVEHLLCFEYDIPCFEMLSNKRTELEELEFITNKDLRDKLIEEYHKRN